MNITLPKDIEDILRVCYETFGEVYLVGGCVRDLLLGVDPKDIDLTTPLKPNQIEDLANSVNIKQYPIGKKFGTIGLIINGHNIEITTFRSEKYEMGSRKPVVKYESNLELDLARRDFTINSIAIGKDSKIIDPFNGQEDLQHKILRSTGVPTDRFREDPLRILRLARFAARYDFEIEEGTHSSAIDSGELLLTVSSERVAQELDNILSAKYRLKVNNLLTRILPNILPGFNFEKLSDEYLNQSDLNQSWIALSSMLIPTAVQQPYLRHIAHLKILDNIARHLKWSNKKHEAIKYQTDLKYQKEYMIIRLAKIIIAGPDNKILLQDRANVRKENEDWGFFGDGIDEGEEPLEAVKRELIEELDYRPTQKIAPLHIQRTQIENKLIIAYFFITRSETDMSEYKVLEGAGKSWFTPDEASELNLGNLFQGTPAKLAPKIANIDRIIGK